MTNHYINFMNKKTEAWSFKKLPKITQRLDGRTETSAQLDPASTPCSVIYAMCHGQQQGRSACVEL